jgi:hypothetical protein
MAPNEDIRHSSRNSNIVVEYTGAADKTKVGKLFIPRQTRFAYSEVRAGGQAEWDGQSIHGGIYAALQL